MIKGTYRKTTSLRFLTFDNALFILLDGSYPTDVLCNSSPLLEERRAHFSLKRSILPRETRGSHVTVFIRVSIP
jgi:hypothetical protein